MTTEKRVLKKIAGVVGATAVASVGLVAVGVAAEGASATTCANNRACLWEDYTYETNGSTTDRFQFQQWAPRLSQHYYSGTSLRPNDNASSAHNNDDSRTAYFYMDPDCKGYWFQKPPNSTDANFNNGSPGPQNFNDELSAVAFGSYIDNCKA